MSEPWIIAAFEGWNDAADAATGVVDHLIECWDVAWVGEVDGEDYYDLQVNRPYLAEDETHGPTITWPATQVYRARPAPDGPEVLLVRGIEPNLRWRRFAEELYELSGASRGVRAVVSVGALLADTPHTRPVPVTGTATDSDLVSWTGLAESHYEGPVGINAVFVDRCARGGTPTVSLWAAVPHYVAQPPCPRATLALLGRVEDVLQMPLPLGDLVEASQAWSRGADELAREDGEIADYVEALEKAQETSDLPEASGDAIARDFERYLRRRSHDTD